jgi:hypothetical protein
MADRKLTDEQIKELAQKYLDGAPYTRLATEYGVSATTAKNVCLKVGAIRTVKPRSATADLHEFEKRSKSVLWRQNQGTEKPAYDTWKARIAALESQDGGNYTHNQAVVVASKEFPCLHPLFRDYDLLQFDPNPTSHPNIQHFGRVAVGKFAQPQIVNEGRQLSYRDSLRWAISAAGNYDRTKQMPTICPCDTAWYLFRQAIDEPKDFLTRVGQIESKGDSGDEDSKNAMKACKKSVAEIDAMLAELDRPEDDECA